MDWLREWFEKAKKVVFSPTDFFEDVEKKEGFSYPFQFAITSLVVMGLLSVAVKYISSLGSMSVMGLGWALFIVILSGLVGGSLGVLAFAGVIHIFVYLIGGRGYQKTVQVYSYATSVSAFFGWIPVVNFVSWIYSLYVQIRGIEKFHDFSTKQATLAVLLPIVIAVLVLVGIVFVMLSMSTVPMTPPMQPTGMFFG